jgi:predicted 3-demethylubiquinone-9 3-methyltransferase (glyoxalase superfamily)
MKQQKIVPNLWFEKLNALLNDPDKERSEQMMKAMLQMKKLDIDTLEKAYTQQK